MREANSHDLSDGLEAQQEPSGKTDCQGQSDKGPWSRSDLVEIKRTSAEIQAQVEKTEEQMSETLDELGRRLSPHHINQEIKHRIQERPYRAGLIAMAAGVLSGMMVRRRFQKA